MIKIINANKFFNKGKKNQIHAINNTSLTFSEKGLVAILGSSGCGKTTLLNAIGGLDKLNKGEIYVNGKRITKISSSKIDEIRNTDIGYIFQNYQLIEDMTVFDNVALVLKMIGVKDKKDIEKNVNYVLEIVGLYEYRNRLVTMLSGGERQRVGIARAIVKNPKIIIADEPTGNLDSRNSLEIMDIIKAISYDKLVILVTHEKDLAYFYATRIIELIDGKVVSDRENTDSEDLDYRIDNKIYLKDIQSHKKLISKTLDIDFYSDNPEKINVTVIEKDGKLYIQSEGKKIDVVDENSNIELVDDKYKKMTKEDYEKYKFDYEKLQNKNRQKYTSIYNPLTLLKEGFKKVFRYSTLKKILLAGFVISAMFIMYSVSNIIGILDIKDSSFVSVNKNYIQVDTGQLNVSDYVSYEKIEGINYIIPGDSIVDFDVKYSDLYYQTYSSSEILNGSLSSINMINKEDLWIGKMPENENEVVIDKMALKNMMSGNLSQQVGLTKPEQYLNRKITINHMEDFVIVGLTDLQSPSIYVDESKMINIIANTYSRDDETYDENNAADIVDYNLYKNKIKIKKGRAPKKDYEVILNQNYEGQYKLNKKFDQKVNGKKLKIVGFYSSKEGVEYNFTNTNTIKYRLIASNKKMSIYAEDKLQTIDFFTENNMNVKDSYEASRNKYIEDRKDSILSSLLIAGVILLISLIEIYLMLRSSFLSRIKEVGTLRAIGLKKKDVYKMFMGEILAITILTSSIGFTAMGYLLNGLSKVTFFEDQFIFNINVVLISIVIVFLFNILVGLIPVFSTLRKTPAEILSRTDAQ